MARVSHVPNKEMGKDTLRKFEKKILKRERQLKRLRAEKKRLVTEKRNYCERLLEKEEARAIDGRVAYYDTIRRPFKKWPRLVIGVEVKPSFINQLEEILGREKDLINPIVAFLAPGEYQSLSLVSKFFQQVLHQMEHISLFLRVVTFRFGLNFTASNIPFVTTLGILKQLIKTVHNLFYENNDVELLRLPTGPMLLSMPSPGWQIYFIDTETMEFGNVTEEIFYTYRDYNKSLGEVNYSARIKCDLPPLFSPVDRNPNLMTSRALRELNINPLSFCQFEPSDLFLLNHTSAENYYRHLIHEKSKIILFQHESVCSELDIYYDWLNTRRIFNEIIKQYPCFL